MKQIKPYSLYALISAFFIHILIVLSAVLFFIYVLKPTSSAATPQEQRVKLSLKANPDAPKEALVKNNIPETAKTLPIPRGEQLSEPPSEKPQEEVSEPKHADRDTAAETALHENEMVNELYGDVFTDLSAGEQKFILDNQEGMRRITQSVLVRYAPFRIPPGLDVNASNMVEFYLHPDGSVSDLRFLQSSNLYLLDSVTLETLEIAYKKYPRPEQKTLIRYKIDYVLGGH